VRSPARHRVFDDIAGLVEFVERIADASGKPVGIKSAVGDRVFWSEFAEHMAATGQGPDSIMVDGGEGGTGAAPLVFADHVALPIRQAFPLARRTFAENCLEDTVVFGAARKLGRPPDAALTLALGADMLGVGREAMPAIGCIQAQECQTGHCPTGAATQRPRLVRGLDPTDKSVRMASYIKSLQRDLRSRGHAMEHGHQSKIRLDQISIGNGSGHTVPATEVF